MGANKTQFVYAADVTALEGKQGKLKKDKDGYYEILLGAYNCYNSAGEFYELTKRVHLLFASSSFLMQRVKNGKLYGEADHPSMDPYLGKPNMMALWMDRLRDIRAANQSHHIRGLELRQLAKQEKGQVVHGIYGLVKPCDERLLASLENPHENTSFSQRAFSNNRNVGYETYREVTEIITYDWVTAGGIPYAAKHQTPSMESLVKYCNGALTINIDNNMMDDLEMLEKARGLAAMENSNIIPVTRIRDANNSWREVPTLDLGVSSHASRKW